MRIVRDGVLVVKICSPIFFYFHSLNCLLLKLILRWKNTNVNIIELQIFLLFFEPYMCI